MLQQRAFGLFSFAQVSPVSGRTQADRQATAHMTMRDQGVPPGARPPGLKEDVRVGWIDNDRICSMAKA